MQPAFGFREHPHTADWELEVWAPDMTILFEQAARGMYTLSGVQIDGTATQERSLAIHASDAEGLLVRFLTELLWLEEEEKLAFDHLTININADCDLWADLRGGLVSRRDKEIKAVTYHNLKILPADDGLHVNIVFDV